MRLALFALALLACLPAGAQQIHRWVDADGRVRYGESPPPGVKSVPVQSRINTYAGQPVVSGAAGGGTRPPIVMYTTEWCTYCKQARAFFQHERIRYAELDVEKSAAARAEYQRIGGRGVPVIVVGTQQMTGFSEPQMRQMLKAAGY